MRRSRAASFVAAAFALFAVVGCASTKGDDGGGGGGGGKQGNPPGLSLGVVQISKISGGGIPVPIGRAVSYGNSELWLLMPPLNYPVMIGAGESLKFDYLGPADDLDSNHDDKVDKAELIASPFNQPWMQNAGATRVTETTMAE